MNTKGIIGENQFLIDGIQGADLRGQEGTANGNIASRFTATSPDC